MDGSEAAAIQAGAQPAGGIPVTGEAALIGRWLVNTVVLALGDAVALTTAVLLAGGVRMVVVGTPMFPPWVWFLTPAWWCGALAIRLLPGWGLGAVEELRRTVLLLSAVFAAATTALFFLHYADQISRLTVSVAFLLCLPLLPYTRVRLKSLLVARGLWGMPCVVYGDPASIEHVLAALRQEPGLGYVPVAIQIVGGDSPQTEISGVPVAPAEAMKQPGAMAAILAVQNPARHQLLDLVEGRLAGFRRVVVVPAFIDAAGLWGRPRDLGGVLGLEISRNLQDGWVRASKRLFDLALLALVSPLWVVAMVVLTVLITLRDRQNPFFVHRRVGLGGREFPMLKFRTMRAGAEAALQQRLAEDEELRRQWELNFKIPNDPRVTRLGRFLRRASLDELPQFLNVLRGEMSVVGPRPLPAYHAREIPERLRAWRETVRPGMTGMWQVSGRSDAGTAGIIRSDAYYLRHWSIWLDIVILVRTIRATLRRTGAY